MLSYPFNAHEGTSEDLRDYLKLKLGVKTVEEMESLLEPSARYLISYFLRFYIDDVMQLTVSNTLNHTTDSTTLAFAQSRIPSNVNHDDTIRFLIALFHEKNIGFQDLIDNLRSRIKSSSTRHKLQLGTDENNIIDKWNKTALKVVEFMKSAPSVVGTTLSGRPDFIRKSALIAAGYDIGLEITTGVNRIGYVTGEVDGTGNTVTFFIEPNKSFFFEKIDSMRIAGTSQGSDTVTLVAKNGPSQLTIGTVKSVLAKDTSKTFTLTELTSTNSTEPILVPEVANHVPDQEDVEVNETRSLSIANVFSGIRLTKTVTSSDTSKATVSFNNDKTSIIITGVAIGDVTLSLTATNEAGNITEEIDITVVAEE